MPLHKKILRLLLASLAIAAVTGAAAVLVGENDTMWRVLATAFTTAGAALLLYPLSRLVDKPDLRVAGVFGMAVVLTEYFLVVVMIWDVVRALVGSSQFEEMITTFFAGLLVGVPATILLLIDRAPHSRIAARTGLGICATALPCMLVGSWGPSIFNENFWVTGAVLLSFGAPIVLSLLEMQHPRHWRWLGVVASVVAAAMAIYHTWANTNTGPELFVVISSIAAAVAYANVILLIPLKGRQRLLIYACIALVIATCLAVDLAVVFDSFEELFGRLAAASGVMAACGTLAILILARLMRGVLSDARTAGGQFTIHLTCPRCRTALDLPPGKSSCNNCDLRFNIDVEEPVCRNCGYLLLNLTGDACPECGRPIADGAPSPAPAGT